MKKIAILASGSGSNAENLHNFFSFGSRVKVELVIYDRKDAPVAERMRMHDVDTLYLPAEVWTQRPDEIVELLRERGIDLVVLAGFLRMVPRAITAAFAGRIINIHPSLLPAYSGKGMYVRHIHEAVIANGEKETGVTVHYVTDDLDSGEILLQEKIEVGPYDTPGILEERIHDLEYSMFPRAVMMALERIPATTVIEKAPEEEDVAMDAAPEEPADSVTPPPVPPGQQWADRLGVNYDPTKLPPEYPGSTAPQQPQQPQQPTPPPYGQQMQWRPKGIPEGEKMPPSYLAWAIVMTIVCCLPAGVVAIIFASQVSSKFYAGDLEGARRSSRNAEIWIIVSFVLGVLFNTLYVPLSLLF